MSEVADGNGVVLRRDGASRVLAVRLSDGSCPALEFLDKLSKPDAAKFAALFDQLLSQGRISNTERFRKLQVSGGPGVWEWKVHTGAGLRLYGVQVGSDWYATHGRSKPGDKQVTAEAARARKIFSGRRKTP